MLTGIMIVIVIIITKCLSDVINDLKNTPTYETGVILVGRIAIWSLSIVLAIIAIPLSFRLIDLIGRSLWSVGV